MQGERLLRMGLWSFRLLGTSNCGRSNKEKRIVALSTPASIFMIRIIKKNVPKK
jgi:hypothetical protein